MIEFALPALVGTNPLGFLAALGALDVLGRCDEIERPTLRWADDLVPHAVIGGPRDLDALVALCDRDRARWRASVLLTWEGEGPPLTDLKPDAATLREWALAVAGALPERAPADLMCALVAEGAVAGKGDAKPTHLHFTAGQQRFLSMVRHLAAAVSPTDFEEALAGPWTYSSSLPTLGWDAGGERLYALRATDPAGEKRGGVPGADWLAFLGLTFFPVATAGTSLRTTGCDPDWKRGRLRWPLWSPSLGPRTIRSLIGASDLGAWPGPVRRARGVSAVLQASIRRSNQGGYGSLGPATLLATGTLRASPGRGAEASPPSSSGVDLPGLSM